MSRIEQLERAHFEATSGLFRARTKSEVARLELLRGLLSVEIRDAKAPPASAAWAIPARRSDSVALPQNAHSRDDQSQ